MTGGAGFAKGGARIRSKTNLLNKKATFQQMKKYLFRRKTKNQIVIDPIIVNELYTMKYDRRSRERMRRRFFVLSRLVIFILIILSFWLLT